MPDSTWCTAIRDDPVIGTDGVVLGNLERDASYRLINVSEQHALVATHDGVVGSVSPGAIKILDSTEPTRTRSDHPTMELAFPILAGLLALGSLLWATVAGSEDEPATAALSASTSGVSTPNTTIAAIDGEPASAPVDSVLVANVRGVAVSTGPPVDAAGLWPNDDNDGSAVVYATTTDFDKSDLELVALDGRSGEVLDRVETTFESITFVSGVIATESRDYVLIRPLDVFVFEHRCQCFVDELDVSLPGILVEGCGDTWTSSRNHLESTNELVRFDAATGALLEAFTIGEIPRAGVIDDSCTLTWVDSEGVWQIDASPSLTRDQRSVRRVSANGPDAWWLYTDDTHGTIWRSPDGLLGAGLPGDGGPQIQLKPSPTLASSLKHDNVTGYLWQATTTGLTAFDTVSMQTVHEIELDVPVGEVTAVGDEIWVPTAARVVIIDPVTGIVIDELPEVAGVADRLNAPDPEDWSFRLTSANDRIWLFDFDSDTAFSYVLTASAE